MQFPNAITLLSILSLSTFSSLTFADDGAPVAVAEPVQAPAADIIARAPLPEPKKGGGGGGSKNNTDEDSAAVPVAVPLGKLGLLGAGVVAGNLFLGF